MGFVEEGRRKGRLREAKGGGEDDEGGVRVWLVVAFKQRESFWRSSST